MMTRMLRTTAAWAALLLCSVALAPGAGLAADPSAETAGAFAARTDAARRGRRIGPALPMVAARAWGDLVIWRERQIAELEVTVGNDDEEIRRVYPTAWPHTESPMVTSRRKGFVGYLDGTRYDGIYQATTFARRRFSDLPEAHVFKMVFDLRSEEHRQEVEAIANEGLSVALLLDTDEGSYAAQVMSTAGEATVFPVLHDLEP